ncbi:MAG: hypothetical protein KGJ62_12965 [Armatimonadetes bacterium]|nr:hypothetical protein [Armatimonadota bacterium]MDE2208020.1 hypothetical protein [Armatimonadota bacterium]
MTRLIRTGSFCAAAGILLSAAFASPRRSSHPWRYAVIFHVANGVRTYAGVTDVLPLSARIDALAAAAPATHAAGLAPDSGDDIWLVGNGTTRDLLFDPKSGAVRFVSAGHMEETAWTIRFVNGRHLTAPVPDDGTISAIVKGAKPFLQPPEFGKGAHGPSASFGEGEYAPLPGTLAGMVANAPVIVLGRIAAVLREQHVRQGDFGPEEFTAFVVVVERYLRSPGAGAPYVIKVMVRGGDLPWTDDAGGGIGSRDIDQPLLRPGARYILFLSPSTRPSPKELRLGYYLAMTKGVWGKESPFDEYTLTEPWRAQVLLQRGMAVAPQLERQPIGYSWTFNDGQKLVDLPESIAEKEIETAVEAYEKRKAADGG